jgi:hypothetical protein
MLTAAATTSFTSFISYLLLALVALLATSLPVSRAMLTAAAKPRLVMPAARVRIRQHTSAYVSIR